MPHEFDSLEAYYKHLRRGCLRALNGDKVRSYEELEIANFLFLNGIEFEYEPFYKRGSAWVYRPDFYIPEADCYLEHFAIDERGRAPVRMGGQFYIDCMKARDAL